jgi:hypothetical protein
MMPTVLRRSGPDFVRNGVVISPKAMIHLCEGCGAEGAPFLFFDGKRMLSWCAYSNGAGYCAKAPAADPVCKTEPKFTDPMPAPAEPTLF